MLHVTRSWLIAFAAAAMATPVGVLILSGVLFWNVNIEENGPPIIAIFSLLLVGFIVLLLARKAFCSLPKSLQVGVSLICLSLLLAGYAFVLSNVRTGA